jgi:hypothetical protein
VYILTAWYFVDSTYSLTIPAGTLIRGDSASGGTLIIKRGAQIFASGTANNPIIFTSNKPAGTRVPGDWGGVIILGAAPMNQPYTTQIEGGFSTVAGATAMYGGDNVNDNSGVLQYVRIEFAGIAFAPDNEINGLTFGGVGAGTNVDHIQVSYANDDDYEFFGGTLQAKYLVGWRSLDDCFDTDFGFSGKLQFLYTKRDPLIYDYSASGSSNGEESDNNATGDFSGSPYTKARFSNWTLVGPLSDTSNLAALNTASNGHWGYVAMIRRASQLSIYNSIMMGWGKGINLRDTLTQRAALNGLLELKNISLQSPREVVVASSSPATGNIVGFNPATWFSAQPGNLGGSAPRQTTDIGLPAAVWNLDNSNNPVPATSSEPATAGTSYGGRLAGDAFYDNVSYRGAFDPTKPMSQQWTANWTNFDPNNYDPEGVTTVSVTIGTPWNLVAVSVVPSTFDADLLFPGKSGSMFVFNTTTQAYALAPTLANGQGYWARYTTSGSNSISGSAVSGTTVTVAQAGWVLLGSMTNPVNISALSLSSGATILGGSGFRFNAGTQAYALTTVINPGEAVWVKVNQACTITYP